MTHNSTVLRKKLHHYIDKVEERKLKAMYTIFEEDIEDESKGDYSNELKALLDKRYEDYKKNGIVITEKEAQKRIKKLLGAIKK